MNLQLKISVFSALLAMSVLPAMAEEAAQATSLKEAIIEGKPTINLKFRYENVQQEGTLDTAEAFTLRSLIGWKTKPFHDVSVTAEVYGVSPLNDDYNDAKKGSPIKSRTKYSTIADPEDYDFHQLYVEWTGIPGSTIKLGRQAMVLDNWRYVGDVRFRQNWQVFNGLSFLNKSLPNTEVALAHYEQVKLINTKIENANIEIANLKYNFTPTTSLVAYGYFIDWNGRAQQAKSNKTFGLRLDGSQKLDDHWKVLYTAEYAKQDDYKDGSKLIDNDYYRVGAGAGYGDWFLRIDQEKLSGNSDNKAFQTPLGTNHLFQGWADQFLVTPNEGIEDTMLIAGGKVKDATIKAEYHLIRSDRNFAKVGGGQGDRYGKELDLGVYYKFTKQISGSLEYANFREDDQYKGARKRDTEKFWLTAIYAF